VVIMAIYLKMGQNQQVKDIATMVLAWYSKKNEKQRKL